ncbi:MAG: hypothetical protein AAF709_09605, partial [Pseudomonadota bacterium]
GMVVEELGGQLAEQQRAFATSYRREDGGLTTVGAGRAGAIFITAVVRPADLEPRVPINRAL